MGEGQGPALRIHARVVGDGFDPRLGEAPRPGLHRPARTGIDQHRPTGLLQRRQHLRQGVLRTAAHGVGQVVAAGGAHLDQWAPQLQQADQIRPHPWRGGGTEGHHRHPRAEAAQLPQPAVVGAEVMAPGADAVGLINGDPHQAAVVLQLLQQLAGGLHLQTLRRQVEQPQAVAAHPGQQVPAPGRIQAPMQTGGGDPAALQVLHLVFHQGHQRRNHQHQPTPHQGRQLITEGFPRPGGEHRQAVTPCQEGLNHLPLSRPKAAPAEVGLQRLLQGIGRPADGQGVPLNRPGPSPAGVAPPVDRGPPPPAAAAHACHRLAPRGRRAWCYR